MDKLLERLKVVEGWSAAAYLDTTSNITVGYGHNLAQLEVVPFGGQQVKGGRVRLTPVNTISKKIGELLLVEDVEEVLSRLKELLPWFVDMDPIRKEVVLELFFNIGFNILQYKVFMRQLMTKDYAGAADNMENWRWRRQVGDGRAWPLIEMMRTGERK